LLSFLKKEGGGVVLVLLLLLGVQMDRAKRGCRAPFVKG
jgi:hypothetical protein